MSATVTLFGSVGPSELAQIVTAHWLSFPPNPSGQSVFHREEDQAAKVAREATGGGFVVRFEVRAEKVGNGEGLTVRPEDLDAFNAAIVGGIHLIAEYAG
ncbi:MAG: ADP-ribosylation/crystallin J1 [Alphaproteobacteria bacterium]|nr:ADP-ribosylation/crystallin J1 [Alphaproteobacteria bacterium]